MNDPIERYYDQFETRYESAMRRSGGSKRRLVIRFAIAGAVAALAVGVGVTVIPSDGKVDVIEEAQAALTVGDKIEHYKFMHYQYNADGTPDRFDDGEPIVVGQEVWRRERPAAVRLLETGRYTSDQASTENESWYYDGGKTVRHASHPFQAGNESIDGIRDGLASGRLREAGTAVIDGRKVLRLVGSEESPYPIRLATSGGRVYEKQKQSFQFRYYVDAVTYAPVKLWTKTRIVSDVVAHSGKSITVDKYLLYEQLQPTANNLKLLRVQTPPGTKVIEEGKN